MEAEKRRGKERLRNSARATIANYQPNYQLRGPRLLNGGCFFAATPVQFGFICETIRARGPRRRSRGLAGPDSPCICERRRPHAHHVRFPTHGHLSISIKIRSHSQEPPISLSRALSASLSVSHSSRTAVVLVAPQTKQQHHSQISSPHSFVHGSHIAVDRIALCCSATPSFCSTFLLVV